MTGTPVFHFKTHFMIRKKTTGTSFPILCPETVPHAWPWGSLSRGHRLLRRTSRHTCEVSVLLEQTKKRVARHPSQSFQWAEEEFKPGFGRRHDASQLPTVLQAATSPEYPDTPTRKGEQAKPPPPGSSTLLRAPPAGRGLLSSAPPSPRPPAPPPPPGPHPQLCQHTAVQAWKRLSRPRRINQKFKAATYHNDSFFTYDENQRGAEIPSILSEVSPARTGYAARVRAADL